MPSSSPRALNFRTLDLNLLRVFDVVMAERNLTRAAVRLSITQPAVSNALKRLRDAVGEDLLLRAPSGVKPTPRAEALWPEVRGALGHLHAALAPGGYDPQHDAATPTRPSATSPRPWRACSRPATSRRCATRRCSKATSCA